MVTKLKNSLATNPAQSYLPNQVLSRAAFLRFAAGMGAALFGHQFAVAQTRDQRDAMQTRASGPLGGVSCKNIRLS
jgi:hypothetical protein